MQCGGIWGTRLDPQVSLGAGLGGAVLVVSPRGMRRKGPGKTSPSQSFWTKKWPDAPLREFHTVPYRPSEKPSVYICRFSSTKNTACGDEIWY